MTVSVIIVTHDRPLDLRRTVEHVLVNGKGCVDEVIIVDNGSTDDVPSVLEPLSGHRSFTLIRLHRNTGVCFARNVGAANARNEYLLFLDDHCFFDFGCLEAIAQHMNNDLNIAIVALCIHNTTLDAIPDEPFLRSPIRSVVLEPAGVFDGGGLIIRRRVFVDLGGYDDRFFYGMEEADLSLRILQRGFSIRRYTIPAILHYQSGTVRPLRRQIFYYYRNRLIVIWKHYPLAMGIIETVGLIVSGFARSLRQGGVRYYVMGVVAGLGHVILGIPTRRPLGRDVILLYNCMTGRRSTYIRFRSALGGQDIEIKRRA